MVGVGTHRCRKSGEGRGQGRYRHNAATEVAEWSAVVPLMIAMVVVMVVARRGAGILMVQTGDDVGERMPVVHQVMLEMRNLESYLHEIVHVHTGKDRPDDR